MGKKSRPPCVLGEYCAFHNFIHGAEAEELRSGVEKLMYGDDPVHPAALRALLDLVDARDSVAYLEHKEKTRG